MLNRDMNEFGTTQNLGVKDLVVCFKVTLDTKQRMYLRVVQDEEDGWTGVRPV